jgi:hypothetical protein
LNALKPKTSDHYSNIRAEQTTSRKIDNTLTLAARHTTGIGCISCIRAYVVQIIMS